jgi:hypothetical protein
METKICKDCGQEKPITEYSTKYIRNGVRYPNIRCRPCVNILQNKFYAKNDSYRSKNQERIRNRRKIFKSHVVELHGNKCIICGYSKYHGGLHFHHKDPAQKNFGLATRRYSSLKKYKEEAEKCILVCGNCHAEIHSHDKMKKQRKDLVARRKKRAEKKRKLINYLGGACIFCGYKKVLAALEFHHIDPSQKKYSIANKINCSFETLLPEVEKCVVVCTNCHAELEAGIISLPNV